MEFSFLMFGQYLENFQVRLIPNSYESFEIILNLVYLAVDVT
jgi:hypothetical protein